MLGGSEHGKRRFVDLNRCAGNINAASPVKRGQGTNENGRTIAETARHLMRAVACATRFLGDHNTHMRGLSAVAWCWKTTAPRLSARRVETADGGRGP
jgi:hypothetical protein